MMCSGVEIGNPGYFVLPDGKIPVLRLKVRRNQHGEIEDLVIDFDPALAVRAKLKSHKSVPLQFRGTAERIEINIPSEFCGWHEDDVRRGFQHLHQTKLDRNQIERIERFLEMMVQNGLV